VLQLIASIALMYVVVFTAGVWSTRKRAAMKAAEASTTSERTEN